MSHTEEGRAAARALVVSRMVEPLNTIAALARATGLDGGTIGDFLNGKRWPQRGKQIKIERAVGLPPGSLDAVASGLQIGPADAGIAAPAHGGLQLDERSQRLVELFVIASDAELEAELVRRRTRRGELG